MQCANLIQKYQQPVTAVHVPCLVISQPVWGWSPLGKLRRSVEMAHEVDAKVVVVHPPFRWQREFLEPFKELVLELHESNLGGIEITVENMYSVEKFGRKVDPYLCADDPGLTDFPSLCLDTSHAAAARWDPIELYDLMMPRVRHIHLSGLDSEARRRAFAARSRHPAPAGTGRQNAGGRFRRRRRARGGDWQTAGKFTQRLRPRMP